MPRPNHAEMPTIQRRQLSLAKPFHHGENGRVDETQVLVGIPVDQLANSRVVLDPKVLHEIRPHFDVTKQREHWSWAHPFTDEVIQLGEDRARDHQCLLALLDQATAARVVTIAAVKRRIERTGVEDQRHDRGGWRCEPLTSPVRDEGD